MIWRGLRPGNRQSHLRGPTPGSRTVLVTTSLFHTNSTSTAPRRCANQSGALVHAIPSEGLAQIRSDERTGDAEEDGEDKPVRMVWARREISRDGTRDEADEDDPKNVHVALLGTKGCQAYQRHGSVHVPCAAICVRAPPRRAPMGAYASSGKPRAEADAIVASGMNQPWALALWV